MFDFTAPISPGSVFCFLSNLSKKQLDKLDSMGATPMPFDLDGESGIIVDGSQMGDIIRELDLDILTTDATTYDGVYNILWRPKKDGRGKAEGNSRIIFENSEVCRWNGKLPTAVMESSIERFLLPSLSKDVKVHLYVPHGSNHGLINNGEFNIFIWSGLGRKAALTPKKMWGIPVDCKDKPFDYSGSGLAIYESGGNIVGELVQNNLYIFHDLVHMGTQREKQIFEHILEEVVYLTQNPEAGIDRQAQHLAEVLAAEYQNTYKVREQQLTTIEDDIQRYKAVLVEKIRAADSAKMMVLGAEEALRDIRSVAKEQFLILRSNDKIERIEPSGDCVTIYTKRLICTHPVSQKQYGIGNFKIIIHLTGHPTMVEWHNLTRQSDCQAPHVELSGYPVAGMTEEMFLELLGNYQIGIIGNLAIQFIETVDPTHPTAERLKKFPLLKESIETDGKEKTK